MKPAPDLIAAYDDALGVTAAFNLNLLRRINRELDADFDLENFHHEARWSPAEKRVEMHLVSKLPHMVTIPAIDFGVRFRAGESIWTESSYKFDRNDPARMSKRAGLVFTAQWLDREWPFAESLLIAG